jgi:N-acetylneuraminic acid mutarotase
VVIGGGTPPVTAAVQQVVPDRGTRVVGALPQVRADLVAALVAGTMYAFGGGDEDNSLVAGVAASADGASWRSAGSLVEAVRYPAIAVVDGIVYLFGGVNSPARTDTRSVQRYDPGTGATTTVAQLPAPLSHATAVVLGGDVYILGGFVDNRLSAQVLRFDPRTGEVAPAGELAAPWSDGAAVVVGGTGYLVGGEGPDRHATTTVTVLRVR